MKRLVLTGIILFLAGGFVLAREYRVGVSLPGEVPFFLALRKGLDEAAMRSKTTLVYAWGDWSARRQLEQVRALLNKDVDAILLCAGDSLQLLPVVELCQKAGVPLLTCVNVLGTDPAGRLDGVKSFIGISDTALGRLLGQMVNRVRGQRASRIVVLEGSPGTGPQRQRSTGFKAIMSEKSMYQIVWSQAIPGWRDDRAGDALRSWLERNAPPDVVVCQWAGGGIAAAGVLA